MNSLLADTPQSDFHSWRYLRNTARRLEHLATLGLNFSNSSILELGAGIGDLTTFFLDRGATVHATEGRPENYAFLKDRFDEEPNVTTQIINLDPPPKDFNNTYDTVISYGLLYHLSDPIEALNFMSNAAQDRLLLESICVPGDHLAINPHKEIQSQAGSAYTGLGCRPTRTWVYEQLKERFEFVYLPTTQPSHIEFPTDWTQASYPAATRAIFIASRTPIQNSRLTQELPMIQNAV
ncbi:MAG: class I SAM-dependent methyltransferase [Phycisphaerales bacterium]|nr:class I SAM-dependent methyltransferase [Phycisphaerales bacterium]